MSCTPFTSRDTVPGETIRASLEGKWYEWEKEGGRRGLSQMITKPVRGQRQQARRDCATDRLYGKAAGEGGITFHATRKSIECLATFNACGGWMEMRGNSAFRRRIGKRYVGGCGI